MECYLAFWGFRLVGICCCSRILVVLALISNIICLLCFSFCTIFVVLNSFLVGFALLLLLVVIFASLYLHLLHLSRGSLGKNLSTSTGSGNACVHSILPIPHLWDFTVYVVNSSAMLNYNNHNVIKQEISLNCFKPQNINHWML